MMIPAVSPAQLEYLEAVLEHATWNEAASRLNVSPSALSQGLHQLEKRLGLTLFERDGRRRRPTAAAIAAHRHAQRILTEYRDLARWADEVRTGSGGTVAIGMIDTAAIHHFGETLVQFRSEHPDLNLQLSVRPSADLLDALDRGDCDAVVAVDPVATERIETEPLIDENLHIYAPPGIVVERPATWGPWVGFPPLSRTRARIDAALRFIGAEYRVVAESSQPAVLREMVRLGIGWTVLPTPDAHELAPARREPLTRRRLMLVTRRDSPRISAVSDLLDRLRATARSSPSAAHQSTEEAVTSGQ